MILLYIRELSKVTRAGLEIDVHNANGILSILFISNELSVGVGKRCGVEWNFLTHFLF